MKKSYLALGLVAAVAMSSCSNDEPIPGGNNNQSDVTKGLEPIVLSMTTSAADVDVRDARTRGTGTVGGLTPETNKWQYEDIYVLMTSSDADCLDTIVTEAGDKYVPKWDFTSVKGVGPFLKKQFDGKFWARPYEKEGENATKWGLDYKIDQNEWWCHLPIDKYYPMKGKSQFFAFYIDDACATVDTKPYDGDAGEDGTHTQSFSHAHPVYTFDADSTYMTVDFKIDGTQDLMVGTAAQGDTYEELGFSAQSARAGIVPSIKMNHLLSRLTFDVKWGHESAEMVQIDAIRVLSENQGKMKVAYSNAYAAAQTEAINFLDWNKVTTGEGEDAVTTNQPKVEFILHEQKKILSVDREGYVLNAEGRQITVQDYEYTYNEETRQYEPLNQELHPYALKPVPGANGVIKYMYEAGQKRVILETVEGLCYVATPASMENGKAKLQPLTSFLMKEVFGWDDETKTTLVDSYRVGEAMFVKPGETEYQMFVDMTMYIRDEATEPEVEGDEDHIHGALTEKITLPLTLKVANGFKEGKSYQVNITIYGLEKVEVEVELSAWEEGGNINVGQDDEYDENGDAVVPENDPSTGDDTEDDENGNGNDPSTGDDTEDDENGSSQIPAEPGGEDESV